MAIESHQVPLLVDNLEQRPVRTDPRDSSESVREVVKWRRYFGRRLLSAKAQSIVQSGVGGHDHRDGFSTEPRYVGELTDRRSGSMGYSNHVVAEYRFLGGSCCTEAHDDKSGASLAVFAASVLVHCGVRC
jgi:hypothetical protein